MRSACTERTVRWHLMAIQLCRQQRSQGLKIGCSLLCVAVCNQTLRKKFLSSHGGCAAVAAGWATSNRRGAVANTRRERDPTSETPGMESSAPVGAALAVGLAPALHSGGQDGNCIGLHSSCRTARQQPGSTKFSQVEPGCNWGSCSGSATYAGFVRWSPARGRARQAALTRKHSSVWPAGTDRPARPQCPRTPARSQKHSLSMRRTTQTADD